MTMQAHELRSAITASMTGVASHADELRDLDAAIGDGDLGITVSSGAKAVMAPRGGSTTPSPRPRSPRPAPRRTLQPWPPSWRERCWPVRRPRADITEIGRADAVEFAQAAADNISKRGKSQVGDKTIFDALVPLSRRCGLLRKGTPACSRPPPRPRRAWSTPGGCSPSGAASWLQERSVGPAGPGSHRAPAVPLVLAHHRVLSGGLQPALSGAGPAPASTGSTTPSAMSERAPT